MLADLQIREALFPADFAPIAAVITAERFEFPVSAEDLAAQEAARDTRFFHLTLVAETAEQMIGMGTVGHIPYMHREGRFGLDLRVRPECQGLGAGKALYEALLARLAPFEPRELFSEVWEALPRPRRFLEERGFEAVWRRIDSALDVRTFDPAPFAGLEERLQADGFEIVTYADLYNDPERDRKLHALDWALLQDMPYGEPQTMISLEEFVRGTIQAPDFLPEACFIARYGQDWVGYSNLMKGETNFVIQMTGVLARWRGRGIATWLKLKDIQYAQAHGGLKLWTTNDSVNTAILKINQKLGFQEMGAMLRYRRLIT